jgi:tRNA1Val (adenine37-N6)-methyltransferase
LWLLQEKHGYRFSLDAVLLAGLTTIRPGERVIDLGTGCGIILLLLACRFSDCTLTGVEFQSTLARLAEKNVRLNELTERVRIIQADVRTLPPHFPPGSFEVVLSNPPYRPLASGRLNPITEKAIARHELSGSLKTVAEAAHYLLAHGGRFYLIYPAWRLVTLCWTLRNHGLEPKTLRLVHSWDGEPASLVWAEARKGGGEELQILPPLIIYHPNGQYTPELEALFQL